MFDLLLEFCLNCECNFYDVKYVTMCAGRLQRLLQEMMSERENKTMVFVETKRRADDLTYRLKRAGYVHSLIMLFVLALTIKD